MKNLLKLFTKTMECGNHDGSLENKEFIYHWNVLHRVIKCEVDRSMLLTASSSVPLL